MNKIHKMYKILALILILILRKTHHFKKVLCQRYFIDWRNHSFKTPKNWGDLVNKGNFIHKYLPKQTDIDQMLDMLQRKVLRATHLPMEINEIQAGYMCTAYFKDLYPYLSQNKLPSLKSVIRKLETLAGRYVLLDLLLFRISLEKGPQCWLYQKHVQTK